MEQSVSPLEQLKDINPPLSFQCTVKGKSLTATVIARMDYGVTNGYRIKFSDGYVSNFYVEAFGWTEEGKEEKPSPYFFAILKDLKSFLHFDIYTSWYCFRLPVDGVETNVFVIYDEESNKHKVHYNGAYQFTLIKRPDKWYAGTERKEDRQPSQELSRNISLLIESAH